MQQIKMYNLFSFASDDSSATVPQYSYLNL